MDGAWRVWETLRDWDHRFAVLVDATIALGLFVVCSGWFGHVGHVGPRHIDVGFVAGLTLPLIFRRRAPFAVFFVIAVVGLAQWSVTASPLLADCALLVALYSVAAVSEWLLVAVAAIVLEIGVILATVTWAPAAGSDFKSWVSLTGLVCVALLTGAVVRALRSQMGWLAERADRLELERDQQASIAAAAERARIAREMHDVVSHNLQVMVTLADGAAVAAPTDQERAREAMTEVSMTGRQALGDMRRMLGLLRDDAVGTGSDPGSGNGGGRGDAELAPQPGLGELTTLIERVCSTGLPVTLERSGDAFELSDAAGLTVYRIIQEALTNTLKHAVAPDKVIVALAFADPDLTVRVSDNGRRGVALGAPGGGGAAGGDTNGPDRGGHGVAGMTERATAFGGTLTAGPGPDGGWSVATTLRGCRRPTHP
jgi:signal transduction histidine kinase